MGMGLWIEYAFRHWHRRLHYQCWNDERAEQVHLSGVPPRTMMETEIKKAMGYSIVFTMDATRERIEMDQEAKDPVIKKLCDHIYLDDSKIKERTPMEIADFLDEAARRNYAKFYVYPFARLRLAFYCGDKELRNRGSNEEPYTPALLRDTASRIRGNIGAIVAIKLTGKVD